MDKTYRAQHVMDKTQTIINDEVDNEQNTCDSEKDNGPNSSTHQSKHLPLTFGLNKTTTNHNTFQVFIMKPLYLYISKEGHHNDSSIVLTDFLFYNCLGCIWLVFIHITDIII